MPHRSTRRTLLRRVGLGAATVVVVGAGATGYRAYDAGVFSAGDGPAYVPWRTWADDPSALGLVGAAILAPSPHNAQGWRFAVAPKRIRVSADAARRVGVTDPYGRERADRERQLGLPAHFGPAFAELMPERAAQPLAAFRLGHPTHAGRPSPRRPVAWVT